MLGVTICLLTQLVEGAMGYCDHFIVFYQLITVATSYKFQVEGSAVTSRDFYIEIAHKP